MTNATLPKLNNPSYATGGRDPFLPFGDGVERVTLVSAVHKTEGYKTDNAMIYTVRVNETTRPNVVTVGSKYALMIKLTGEGRFDKEGTPLYFRAMEMANITACAMGMTHAEATAAGIDLDEQLQEWLALGEGLEALDLKLEIRSFTKKAQVKGAPAGTEKDITNHAYSPVR